MNLGHMDTVNSEIRHLFHSFQKGDHCQPENYKFTAKVSDFIHKRYNVTTEWPLYRNVFNYLFNFKPQLNLHLAKGRSYFQ